MPPASNGRQLDIAAVTGGLATVEDDDGCEFRDPDNGIRTGRIYPDTEVSDTFDVEGPYTHTFRAPNDHELRTARIANPRMIRFVCVLCTAVPGKRLGG